MKKRLLSLFLAVVMLFSVLPVGVVAVETDAEETVWTEQNVTTAEETESESTDEETTETEDSIEPEEPAEPEHTHAYTEVVTAPTCTEQGYTTYTCT